MIGFTRTIIHDELMRRDRMMAPINPFVALRVGYLGHSRHVEVVVIYLNGGWVSMYFDL